MAGLNMTNLTPPSSEGSVMHRPTPVSQQEVSVLQNQITDMQAVMFAQTEMLRKLEGDRHEDRKLLLALLRREEKKPMESEEKEKVEPGKNFILINDDKGQDDGNFGQFDEDEPRPVPTEPAKETKALVTIPTAVSAPVAAMASKETEDLKAEIKALNKKFAEMEMHQGLMGHNNKSLTQFPTIQYPEKFKDVSFTKYEGESDPNVHLIIYEGELGPHAANEELKKLLFQKSLGKSALAWFVWLDKTSIQSWSDLRKAFLDQFGILEERALNRWDLEKMRKGQNESMKKYAMRWKSALIQVYPCIPQSEWSELFVRTLKDTKYFAELRHHTSMTFMALIKEAIKVEEWINEGVIEDTTWLKEMKELIKTGTYAKKGNKKKEEEDVALVLPTPKKNVGASGSGARVAGNAQTNQAYQGQQGRRFEKRDRTFTPLGQSYESVLKTLMDNGLITSYLPVPNHDPASKSYDASQRCTYHSSAVGHSTEKCWALKHKIQDFIDAKQIVVQGEPNVQTNPLPNHANVNAVDFGMRAASFPVVPPTKLKESEDQKRSIKKIVGEAKLKKDETRRMFSELAWDDVKLQPSCSVDDTGAAMQMMFLPPEKAKEERCYAEKKNA